MKGGFAVIITEEGKMEFWVGNGKEVEVIRTQFNPEEKRWVEVKIFIEAKKFTVSRVPLALSAESGAPAFTCCMSSKVRWWFQALLL